MARRQRVIDTVLQVCGGSVLNRRVGVLGAAFKPRTDDARDSPALNVAAALHLRGAQVVVFDPQAGATAQRQFPTLGYGASVAEAVAAADVVLVLTEWGAVAHAAPARLRALVPGPRVGVARHGLAERAWRAAGWWVHGLARAREAPAEPRAQDALVPA